MSGKLNDRMTKRMMHRVNDRAWSSMRCCVPFPVEDCVANLVYVSAWERVRWRVLDRSFEGMNE